MLVPRIFAALFFFLYLICLPDKFKYCTVPEAKLLNKIPYCTGIPAPELTTVWKSPGSEKTPSTGDRFWFCDMYETLAVNSSARKANCIRAVSVTNKTKMHMYK